MNIKDLFKSNLFTNIISLSAVQGVNYLLPLISIPYLIKVLGVERYGLYAFAISICQYLILFVDFGFSYSATRFIAENRSNKNRISRYLNATLFASIILVLISLLILILFVKLSYLKTEQSFYFSFFGMVVGNALFPNWYFQGNEKMKVVSIINISIKIISYVPIFFLVRTSTDYYMLPYFNSIGYLLAGLISLFLIYFYEGVEFNFPKYSEIYNSIKDSFSYFIARASVAVYSVSNPIVLGLTVGNVSVAYYDVADKIYKVFNTIYLPISNALFPFMVKNKRLKLFRKIFLLICLMNIAIISNVFFFAEELLESIFNINNVESVNVLKIIILACIFSAPSILIGYPLIGALGFPKLVNYSGIIVSIVHIFGISFLYYSDNVSLINIALLLVLSESLLFLIRYVIAKKLKLL